MFKLWQLGFFLGVLATVSARGESGRQGVAEVLDALRDRHQPITALSCVFRRKQLPTPYFVARAAKDLDVPAAKVEEKYKLSTVVNLIEVADGRYFLQSFNDANAGRPERKDVMGFDSRMHWKQIKVPIDDDPTGQAYRDSQTELGGKGHETLFSASAYPMTFLGDSVLPFQKRLDDMIREGATSERLGDEQAVGAPCVVIRWQALVGGVEQRNTAWLDKTRGFALRKAIEEYQLPDQKWIRTRSVAAAEMGVAHFKNPSGQKLIYHYPKILLSETYNSDDNLKTFDERIEFDEVQINPPTPNDQFAVRIDEGSSVLNLDSGKYSVYGGGPGVKLKQIVDRRVKEADRQAKAVSSLGEPGLQSLPPTLASRGMWAGLALGVAGIAVALILKVRGSRGS